MHSFLHADVHGKRNLRHISLSAWSYLARLLGGASTQGNRNKFFVSCIQLDHFTRMKNWSVNFPRDLALHAALGLKFSTLSGIDAIKINGKHKKRGEEREREKVHLSEMSFWDQLPSRTFSSMRADHLQVWNSQNSIALIRLLLWQLLDEAPESSGAAHRFFKYRHNGIRGDLWHEAWRLPLLLIGGH